MKASLDESDGSYLDKYKRKKIMAKYSKERTTLIKLPTKSILSGKKEDSEEDKKTQDMISRINMMILGKSESSSESEWADFCEKDSDKKASQDKNSMII